MSEECYTRSYLRWIFIMVIPGFLIYALIFPFFFSYYMHSTANENMSNSIEMLRKNHILKQGFRKEKHYWYLKLLIIFCLIFTNYNFRELVALWEKIILFAIAIFIDNIPTRISLFLLILFFSVQFQSASKPYLTENLNFTKKNACVSTFLIFIVKSFNFTMDGNAISEIVCMIIVMILEIQFLYICLLNTCLIKIHSYVMARQKKKKTINEFVRRLSKSKNLKKQFILI